MDKEVPVALFIAMKSCRHLMLVTVGKWLRQLSTSTHTLVIQPIKM